MLKGSPYPSCVAKHAVTNQTWVARSTGTRSADFITGNVPAVGTVAANTTNHHGWYFEVAVVGPVSIDYEAFSAHWLPRGW